MEKIESSLRCAELSEEEQHNSPRLPVSRDDSQSFYHGVQNIYHNIGNNLGGGADSVSADTRSSVRPPPPPSSSGTSLVPPNIGWLQRDGLMAGDQHDHLATPRGGTPTFS